MLDYAEALNQTFILPIGNHEGWISTYLPANAILRAAVHTVADPALTSPLLVGFGAIALWHITLRLWPHSKSTQATALILYATSSEVLIMGMTSYAMSAHLALNLIWLALFLRNDRSSHLAAVAVGFVATGLHQPLFHPLFVLPFMLLLFHERKWRMLLFYVLWYGLICMFWLAWPVWISSFGISAPIHQSGTPISYMARIAMLLKEWDTGAIWLMSLNLLRFLAWQHVFLFPLLVLGFRTVWQENGIFRALALSVLFTTMAMLILLPYQGHGWGYRYLHGVIGNLCLLGAYGWHMAMQKGKNLERAFVLGTAISLGVVLPMHAYMAQSMVAPYAKLDQIINQSDARVAIIQTAAAPFAQDLVLNRPDLSNRPLRLRLEDLTDNQLKVLCRSSRTMIMDSKSLAPVRSTFGIADTIHPAPFTCPD
ncbi:hypothetical protein C1T17_08390 [Sphingobium sp. SCG-1]|nr:hypothetical protein C1T17_08390 [Sphingobium sp. SCG-1]